MLRTMKDPAGNPFRVRGAVLVVGAGLAGKANRLLSAYEVRDTSGTRETLSTAFPTNDDAGIARPRLAVNDYISSVVTSGTAADTSWWLFADPSIGRPAGEMLFRTGKRNPRVMMRRSDKMAISGFTSDTDPDNLGSFDSDTVEFRISHDVGAGIQNARAVVASAGTG